MGLLGRIFGSSDLIKAGADIIDDLHYSDAEEAADKLKAKKQDSDNRIAEKSSYHPYKLTQRLIALSFVGVYLFLMLNGILGILYGIVDINAVKDAITFGNKMFLGEITLTIIIFYFGDVVAGKFANRPGKSL